VAPNGSEALRLWKEGSYALLLSDLHMPGLDGYELVQEIRGAEAPDCRLPIVALTGNALRGEASRALAAGFDEYLTKPTQLDVLRATLEKWLPHAAAGEDGDADRLSPGQAGAAGAADPVDTEVLRRLVGDDRALWVDLLGQYRAGALRGIGELQAAVATGDWTEVAAVAHRLKSPSRTIGATALGDICAEIENEARLGDDQAVATAVGLLEAGLAGVIESIDCFCTSGEQPGDSANDRGGT